MPVLPMRASPPVASVETAPRESPLYGGALLGSLGLVLCAAAVSFGYPWLLGLGLSRERILLIAAAVVPSVCAVALPGRRGGAHFFLRLGWLLTGLAALLVPGRGWELLFLAPLVAGLPAVLWTLGSLVSRRRRR